MSRLLKMLIPVIALIGAQLACVQDCSLSTFKVVGYVNDQAGNPIEGATITAYNNGSFEKPPFNVTTTSDANGYFETEAASSFACTPFVVIVSADGYKSFQEQYYAPGEEWPHELPPEVTITLEIDNS
jgi:carboxypeptidase family protein